MPVTSNGVTKDPTYVGKGASDRLQKRTQLHSEKKPQGSMSGYHQYPKAGVPVVTNVTKATPQKNQQTERMGQGLTTQQNAEFSGS